MEEQNTNPVLQPKAVLQILITALLLELAGFIVIGFQNWRIMVGCFLLYWGQNIINRIRINKIN